MRKRLTHENDPAVMTREGVKGATEVIKATKVIGATEVRGMTDPVDIREEQMTDPVTSRENPEDKDIRSQGEFLKDDLCLPEGIQTKS
jgi:hypothetical protein